MRIDCAQKGIANPRFKASGLQIRWNGVIPSTKTNLKTIGVLKYFKGSAGILLEMGGISSEANRNNIINNYSIIGREIATGVYQYLNNGTKPPTAIYKCIYY